MYIYQLKSLMVSNFGIEVMLYVLFVRCKIYVDHAIILCKQTQEFRIKSKFRDLQTEIFHIAVSVVYFKIVHNPLFFKLTLYSAKSSRSCSLISYALYRLYSLVILLVIFFKLLTIRFELFIEISKKLTNVYLNLLNN